MENKDRERIKQIAKTIADIERKVNKNLMSPDEAEDKILDLMTGGDLFAFLHMDEIDDAVREILKEN